MPRTYKRNWPGGRNPAGTRKSSGRKTGESWGVAWKDQNGEEQRKSGFRTKEEAHQYGRQMEEKVLSGTYNKLGERITIFELAQEYFDALKLRAARDNIGTGHVSNRQGHLENYIVSDLLQDRALRGKPIAPLDFGWKHRNLASIRPVHIQDFKTALLRTKLSTSTIRAIMGTLHSMFDHAIEREYLNKSPTADVHVETPRGERSKRRYPPSQTSFDYIRCRAEGDLRVWIDPTASTGLREGEFRALKNRCFDFDRRTLSVTEAVGRKYKVGVPTSEAGIRKIPLSKAIAERMKAYIEEKGAPDHALTFQTAEGGIMPEGTPLSAMDELIAGLGWPRQKGECPAGVCQRFTWHGLRHYAISWIAAAIAPKAVQTFAGHSSINVTFDLYGHLFPDDGHWDKMDMAAERIFGEA